MTESSKNATVSSSAAAAYWSPLLDMNRPKQIVVGGSCTSSFEVRQKTSIHRPSVLHGIRENTASLPCSFSQLGSSSKDIIESLSSLSVSPIKKLAAYHDSPTSVIPTSTVTDQPWRSPRWKELNEKRLALANKRVQLEQQLFESCSSSPKSAVALSKARTCRLSDGSPVEWSGDLDHNSSLPSGYGKMVFRDGQVYEGRVLNGLRHGAGKNIWSKSGQVYNGEWQHGRRNGRGTHTWADGKTVTGQWQEGHLHGRVRFCWPDGASYDGDCVNGRKQGRGTNTQQDGSVHQGEFWAGYQHGSGTLITNDGQQYRGTFCRGKRHGRGVQIWNTKTYEGEWEHSVIEGHGKLVWRDTGAVYVGRFHQGQLHGEGSYNNGKKAYTGEWNRGVRHGLGIQRWACGRVYVGWFHQNKRHGYGRMMYPDDTVYAGAWQDGYRSGIGVEVSGKDRSIRHCGIWKDNEPMISAVELKRPMDDSNLNKRTSSTIVAFKEEHSSHTALVRSRSFH